VHTRGIGRWYVEGPDSIRATWVGSAVGGTVLHLHVTPDGLQGTATPYGDMPHAPIAPPSPVSARRIRCS
jgi:hypothetical protein